MHREGEREREREIEHMHEGESEHFGSSFYALWLLHLYVFNPSSKCEGMPTQRLEERRVEECAGREGGREGGGERERE